MEPNRVKGVHTNSRVEKKIREIAAIAPLMPCVIVIHDLPAFTVKYMSPLGLQLLGKEWHEIEGMSNEAYHNAFFNAEDAKDYVPKILDMIQGNTDEIVSFFQQVRTSATAAWDWYMSNIRILLRDDSGNPCLTITAAMQVDPHHYFTAKAVRLLEDKAFLKKNYDTFANLTPREKEVLKLMALGKSASEVSETLHISVATAETHRKNIRQKLNVANNYDISRYAQAFDLI